ncbi:MAG: hypothetical protein IPP91_04140 [Betaproteobacteria bacterium]|nr:hypothetical protein [Betaproteobacteria bacterium]
MRRLCLALAGVAIAASIGGCATAGAGGEALDTSAARVPRDATPGLLRNADFEAAPDPWRPCPASWWCTMHNDTTAFAFSLASDPGSQGRYLKVTRIKKEPWAMATQSVPGAGLVGKRLRVSVAVNAEGLDGSAGVVIILHGPGGGVLDDRRSLLTRAPGWRRAGVDIDVPAGTELVEVALILEGGGEVCFDDVEVAVLPPSGP